MAKAQVFSPQLQNCKNQILGNRIILQGETLISLRLHHRIFYDTPKKFSDRSSIIKRNIENVLNFEGVASVSADSYRPLRSSGDCLRLSSLSLLSLRRSRSPYLQFLPMSSLSQSDADTNNTPQESTKSVKCVIKGRVQGVFYRNWTVENATQLGLKGWVRNRRDGAVEALFSGKPEAVNDMLQRCRRGPPDAMVTAFEAQPCNEEPGTDFERKRTV